LGTDKIVLNKHDKCDDISAGDTQVTIDVEAKGIAYESFDAYKQMMKESREELQNHFSFDAE